MKVVLKEQRTLEGEYVNYFLRTRFHIHTCIYFFRSNIIFSHKLQYLIFICPFHAWKMLGIYR